MSMVIILMWEFTSRIKDDNNALKIDELGGSLNYANKSIIRMENNLEPSVYTYV